MAIFQDSGIDDGLKEAAGPPGLESRRRSAKRMICSSESAAVAATAAMLLRYYCIFIYIYTVYICGIDRRRKRGKV